MQQQQKQQQKGGQLEQQSMQQQQPKQQPLSKQHPSQQQQLKQQRQRQQNGLLGFGAKPAAHGVMGVEGERRDVEGQDTEVLRPGKRTRRQWQQPFPDQHVKPQQLSNQPAPQAAQQQAQQHLRPLWQLLGQPLAQLPAQPPPGQQPPAQQPGQEMFGLLLDAAATPAGAASGLTSELVATFSIVLDGLAPDEQAQLVSKRQGWGGGKAATVRAWQDQELKCTQSGGGCWTRAAHVCSCKASQSLPGGLIS